MVDGAVAPRTYFKMNAEVPMGAYQTVAIGLTMSDDLACIFLKVADAPGTEAISHVRGPLVKRYPSSCL